MTFFETLREETATEQAKFATIQALQAGFQGNITLETYIAFLTQAYHHVKHTTPLLMACGARLPERLEWLREAVGEYIEEEMGHQEWILNDIEACGGSAEAVRHGEPAMETKIMVAYAYDAIARGNPVGFFGMVLVLEGTSIQMATHAGEKIQTNLSLPDSAFSYLSSHGSLDISHMQTFETLMNRLEEPTDQAAVVDVAKVMYRLYGDIFRGLPLELLNGEA
jgi:pyrroloquinoline quinone (PQQ) biosynthesis protein C